jgi:antitoxin component of RelBE/YafQ-DinJ toxin-antitoxin module
MQTKLTLRVDEELVARAKDVAKANGTSVSRMVEAWFAQLTSADAVTGEWVAGLRGVLPAALEDSRAGRDYHEAMIEKHSR